MPQARKQRPTESVPPNKSQPTYMSKTKSAIYATLLLVSWALLIGMSFYFNFPAMIAGLVNADMRNGTPGGLFLIGGIGAFLVTAPLWSFRFFKNILRLNDNTVPEREYENDLRHEKNAINQLEKTLKNPDDKVFVRKLKTYINTSSKAHFNDWFGDKINPSHGQYDTLKTLQWIHKKLDKVNGTPSKLRKSLEKRVLDKAKTNFGPFIDIQEQAKRRQQGHENALRLQEQHEERARTLEVKTRKFQ